MNSNLPTKRRGRPPANPAKQAEKTRTEKRMFANEQMRLRRAVLKVLPLVLQKLLNLALEGDVQAARLLLERALPPLANVKEAIVLTEEEAAAQASTAGRVNPDLLAAIIKQLYGANEQQ